MTSFVLTTFASRLCALCWVLLWMTLALSEARYVYWAAGGSYSYDEAKAACEKDIYSHLAAIPDASVTAQISLEINFARAELWVGARKGPGPSYTLRWVTGAVGAEDGGQGRAFWSSTQGSIGYTNFQPGEPYIPIQQYEFCMSASSKGWNDNSCNQKKDGGLCETFRCRAGSYNPVQSPAQFRCDSCGAGMYLPSEGATSSSECTPCSPGSYSGVQSAYCSACSAGTFSPNSGSSACANCSAGTFAATEGCSTCSSCPPGTFNSMRRQSRCSPCPIGSFNPDTGSLNASACIPCPKNTYSAVEARTQLSDCLPCPAGMHSEGGSDSCTATPTFSVTSTTNRTASQGVSRIRPASKSLTSASLSPHLTDPTTTLNQTASLYTRTNSTTSTISVMQLGQIAISVPNTVSSSTQAATAAALVAAAASGGGVELQGAIVLAMMDCSNEYVRKASDKSSRLVTLLYDQSPIVRVLGNLMVAVAALCVHCAAVIAVHLCSSAATLAEAAAKCRFPGLSHRVFLVCFHGLVLQSLLGLRQQSDDTSTQVAACVGLFACIGVPVLVIVQCTRATSNVAYSPYLVALEKYPRCIRTLLLPRGWWQRSQKSQKSDGFGIP